MTTTGAEQLTEIMSSLAFSTFSRAWFIRLDIWLLSGQITHTAAAFRLLSVCVETVRGGYGLQRSHCWTKRQNRVWEVVKKRRRGGWMDPPPWLTFSSAARSAFPSSRSTPLSSASEFGPAGLSRCWTLPPPAGGDTIHSADSRHHNTVCCIKMLGHLKLIDLVLVIKSPNLFIYFFKLQLKLRILIIKY